MAGGGYLNVKDPNSAETLTLQRVLLYDQNGNALIPGSPAQDALVTGTITASAQTVTVPVAARAEMGITVHGTYAGVKFQVDGSDDGGTTWYATLPVTADDTSIVTAGGSDVTPGTNGQKTYTVLCAGLTHVRFRSTAYTSGTANVGLTATAVAEPFLPSTDSNGNQQVTIRQGGANISSSNGGDGVALTTGLVVRTQTALYNGTNWDMWRANVEATLLASAARTATVSTADQIAYNGKALRIAIDVTVKGGAAPSVVFTVEVKDPASGVYTAILTSAAITGVSHTELRVGPGIAAVANAAAQDVIARTWRVTATHANSDSITYSLSSVTLV